MQNREEPLEAVTKFEWSSEFSFAGCETCHRSFLTTVKKGSVLCPNCYSPELSMTELTNSELAGVELPIPELLIPFNISIQAIQNAWVRFFKGYWFKPPDLNAGNLHDRLVAVYLPGWLVDAEVQAEWQAEAGYYYQVVSHKDRYDENMGGWQSQEIQETRLRWLPRIGTLHRRYLNIPAPALDNQPALMSRLGPFSLNSIQPFDTEEVRPNLDFSHVFIQLPDREQHDVWSEAEAGLERSAVEECRQATGADQIRSFRWSPEFSEFNWTLNMFPVLSTFYRDEEGQVYGLLLNGQTGIVSGKRRASMTRARKVSLWFLIAGLAALLLSALGLTGGILSPLLVPVGLAGLVLVFILGVAAVVPVAVVWWFNRKTSFFSG